MVPYGCCWLMLVCRGSTHKTQILELNFSGYQLSQIEQRTYNSETAVKRYIQDFSKIILLHLKEFSIDEIRIPTGFSNRLIGEYIGLYLEVYLVPTISQKTNHSKEAVERYVRDFEAIRMLNSKFDDLEMISLITRLSQRVVNQYVDLLPVEG